MFKLPNLLSALNLLFQDPVLLIRMFIAATFLFSGISMYFFAYHYTKRKVASLCCSIIFMMSQWYASQFTSGHLNFAFAYAMIPTLFFSLARALGWKPKTPFEEDIKKTIEWYIDNGRMWGHEKREWQWRY